MNQYSAYEFRFFIDEGHAWLEVPLSLLLGTGRALLISEFSYMHNGYAYLEEDMDADTFLSHFTNDEYSIEYIHVKGMATIRNYERFRMYKQA